MDLSEAAKNLLSARPMNLSKLGRLVLAFLLATNGVPALLASNSTPVNKRAEVTDWANALGLSGESCGDRDFLSRLLGHRHRQP